MTHKNPHINFAFTPWVLTALLFLLGLTAVLAEGSKDLYPAGAQGGRAYLRASTTSNIAFPYPTLATHYVYAEAGERIALASSAQSGTANRIRLYGPNNSQITLSFSSGNGNIPNRAGELAGPRLPGQGTGGNRYAPIYHQVTQTGIYRVEFISTSGNTTGEERIPYVAANSNWSQPEGSTYLAAWDISVAKETGTTWSWQKGRAYTTVMNMDNPSYGGTTGRDNANFRPNSGFHGEFKVLTRDGYVYNVNNNGNQGISFTFMVNNRGFHEPGTPDVPLYKSIQAPNEQYVRNRYHDPRSEDSGAAVSQKIFYNNPDFSMPTNSIGAVPGGETWLRIEEKNLDVNEILIEGVEGTPNQIGNKGAYIKFFNESGGDYFIEIRPKAGSLNTFPTRELTGNSIIGENKIFWDGKDGNGNLLPNGLADVEVELKLRGAEVHFPYIDMELNANGIILELLTQDLNSVRSDIVFWNDIDIPSVSTGTFGSMTSPRNASHTVLPAGTSSVANGHKWGVGTNRTAGSFGDEMGMDTWTFIEGDATVVDLEVNVKVADLYTKIDYSINGTPNASTGVVGDAVVFTVTAGNDGPSDVIAQGEIKGAPFTFTVPSGVDITNPNNIQFTTSCNNGTASESVAMTYDPATRTFRSELSLSNGCELTYTFTGTINDKTGSMVPESTIMRPADVTDPDATNGDVNMPPSNPHYECYNNDSNNLPGGSGEIGCNNIREIAFMVYPDCLDQVLYFEDFDRGYFAQNSGRKPWEAQPSIGFDTSNNILRDGSGNVIRSGPLGGATPSYQFAPGIEDPIYPTAQANAPGYVARILNGYYAVTPPGYVKMGLDDNDPWKTDVWDPNNPNSYDWTAAWDEPGAVRDMSGAVNGAAFLVRGAASASQSIKPFYQFDVPGTIGQNETYTLDIYSFVTYHDKDYMLMDVVDKNSGFIYATVPLKYPGTPPSGSGPSFGWVPLTASFTFDDAACADGLENKEVYIAIRGSQDRALDTGKGFGHTLIDNIMFSKRSTGAGCNIDSTPINCMDDCYEDIQGAFDTWNEGSSSSPTIETTLHQPGTNGGFVLDIYYLDNSFNMEINGVSLYDEELEFQSGVANAPQNVRFKSDKAIWQDGTIQDIWKFYQGETITEQNKRDFSPIIRVRIDKYGNATLFGAREEGGTLEELEVFDSNGVQGLNPIHWYEDTSMQNANIIKVTQNVVGPTAMTLYGYGQNVKECETCILEKDGVFNDENGDGFAKVGETITYTFNVINAGDMDISDVEIVDPLFGFNITLDSNNQPLQPGVTLTGDTNGDGILNWNETWTYLVEYTVTATDIFTTKGVYNRAKVIGTGALNSGPVNVDVDSIDPTPYVDGDVGWDPDRPFHTFVPLKGRSLLITNPNIYQRVKKAN